MKKKGRNLTYKKGGILLKRRKGEEDVMFGNEARDGVCVVLCCS
jgi:hypothetical protein